MKKITPALFALVTLAACSQPAPGNTTKADSAAMTTADTAAPKAPAPSINAQEFQTKTGKTWIISEEKISASQSNLQIGTRGFSAVKDSVKIEGTDPLEQVILADLNKDGFEEVYLITRSTGSGSSATLHGFGSNKDKSFSGIHVQEVTDKDVYKGGKFEGYMGHDSIYLQGSLLARQFPVYKDGDANAAPTGGKRIIFYTLKAGEATWQLTISSMAQSK